MEKLLFARVEAWVVALIVIAMTALAVLFGWTVLKAADGPRKQGMVRTAALDVARLPDTVKDLIKNRDPRQADRTERFGQERGWVTHPDADTSGMSGYILLSRMSGDDEGSVVELVDLGDMSARYVWALDADALLADAPRESTVTDFSGWNKHRFRAIHPLLLEVGDMIVKDHEVPLMRLDACGGRKWMEATDLYHHSTMPGPDGTLWVPVRIEPSDQSPDPDFNDDAAAEVTLDGKLLREISLTKLMIGNGMKAHIFTAGAYLTDPIHLNDIEPVFEDGPFWKKGDLFLSLRHQSMLMLIRPSTGKILWHKIGPWLGQHDIDILDDHRIAVFDNNSYDNGRGTYIDGRNEILVYDFSTDTVTSPWKDAMVKADMLTASEGLFDIMPSGHVMMEEANSGRLVILDPAGKVAAEYYNRDATGRIFKMAWSRYVPKELGDKALAALAATTCAAPG